MASTGLNFSNLTPDNGAIKDLKRLIFLAVTDPESLGKIFNFLPKQKHGEKGRFHRRIRHGRQSLTGL